MPILVFIACAIALAVVAQLRGADSRDARRARDRVGSHAPLTL